MKFSEIPGQEEVKSRLLTMADTGRIPHALLISGKAGIGKMKLARAFAQYIHCQNPRGGDSCGECPSCRQAAALSDPDIIYSYPVIKKVSNKPAVSADFSSQWAEMLRVSPDMDFARWQLLIGAENKQPVIYVDEADRIVYQANLSTMAHKEKIFIVWLPEKLNVETANKLLKILEEPFADTYFILVSNEPAQILPTIFSRVQRLNVKPLSEDLVSDWLETSIGISPAKARSLAVRAEGSLLKAAEIAAEAGESDEFTQLYIRMMRAAYGPQMAELRDLSEEIAGFGREKALRFLDYTGRMTRENFIYNLQYPELNRMSDAESNFSIRFSAFVNERNVEEMAKETARASEDISRNANSRIVLFDYMLKLAILLKK